MKLYLVQHGEAYIKEMNPARPLTDKGKNDINRLAVFLKHAGVTVERVIHSGKLRAKETAQRLANAIAREVELEISDFINPNDDPDNIDWYNERSHGDTLIVGHLPFLAKLVTHLLLEDEKQIITNYKPGTVVCLELNDRDQWQINWMLRPDLFR